MEDRLANLPKPSYLTTDGLLDLYKDYKNPKDKIKNLVQKGDLRRVRRNLYIPGENYRPKYSREVLANLIFGPSAVSLEYALYYYGLIPERVETVTSICFKRNKKFDTQFGIFHYKYIDEKLFPVGLNLVGSGEGNFHIASAEKALCDLAYFSKIQSLVEAKQLLRGLRIDLSGYDINAKLLFEISNQYKRNSVLYFVEVIFSLMPQAGVPNGPS